MGGRTFASRPDKEEEDRQPRDAGHVVEGHVAVLRPPRVDDTQHEAEENLQRADGHRDDEIPDQGGGRAPGLQGEPRLPQGVKAEARSHFAEKLAENKAEDRR